MPSVLLTAFKPYDRWSANASWLCVEQLMRDPPMHVALTTRLYPVDFAEVRARLCDDLATDYDVIVHLGQAPHSPRIQLEQVAVNVALGAERKPDEFTPLEPGGPAAYQSTLPLTAWAAAMRQAGIPAELSFHAGTYLCNAVYYWSCHFAAQRGLRTRATMIHLPLDPSQVNERREPWPSLPAAVSAQAVRIALDKIAATE